MAENRVRIRADVEDRASGPMDRLRSKIDSVASAKGVQTFATGFGLGVGASIATAGIDLITSSLSGLVGGSIEAASNLNETTSKVGVVFGAAADKVKAFGDTSAQAMGMSKNAALSAAGTYGNLFVSMGLTTDKAADMSMGLVKLASDLASFNNQDPTEVMEKLRAGLVGETEPLRSLGVNLNQAAIDAKAMEMGLAKTGETVSAAARAQASYALILEQTKTAQGDFARTSDGLANQQRILSAEWEDAQAKLGAALLPAMVQLAKVTTDLIKGVDDLAGAFGRMIGAGSGAADIARQTKEAEEKLAEKIKAAGFVLDETTGEWITQADAIKKTEKAVTEATTSRWAAAGRQAQAAAAAAAAETKAAYDSNEAWKKYLADVVAKVNQTQADIAASIRNGRAGIVAAMSETINATYDPLINASEQATRKIEIDDLRKQLSSKKLTAAERAELQTRLLEAQKAYDTLLAEATQYGDNNARIAALKAQLTSKNIIDGLNSGDPARRAAARAATEGILAELTGLLGPAFNYGNRTGNSWADGLAASREYAKMQARALVASARGIMQAFSPPGPESPLHDIDKWGYNTGVAYADGLASARGRVRDASEEMLGGVSAPGNSGGSVAGQARGANRGGSGGVVINAPITIQTLTGTIAPGQLEWLQRQLEPVFRASLRRAGYTPALRSGI